MQAAADEPLALATGGMPATAVVAAVQAAEAFGCEAALIGEGVLEADALVTSMAALLATERIRVGPGIVTVFDRHPAALARAAATLDRLAPGRALLGIGRGERATIADALGLDWGGGQDALEDTLRICRALLDGGPAIRDGGHWSAELPAPPRRAAARSRVPLLLAAVGARTLRLGGALADAVLLNYGATPEYVRWAVAEVAAGAAAAGRPAGAVDILGYVLVARTDLPDAAERVAAVRATLESLLTQGPQATALLAPLGRAAPAQLDDALLRRLAAVGDLGEVRGRLAELRAAGIRCPVLMPSALRALRSGTDP